MNVLNVTYKCRPGMGEKFIAAINAEGIGAACRAEALAVHSRQPHFARVGELKPAYVNDTVVEKYESLK